MEQESIQQKALGFFKANKILAGVFLGGMIFIVVGLIQFMKPQDNSITFQRGQGVESASTSAVSSEIMVDVGGAVKNPGVYKLSTNARVQDALSAAGGLDASADQNFVARSINLAMIISDGMKIYIPKVGETPAVSSLSSGSSQAIGQSTTGLTSINTASESELEALAGIGPVTAGKIISGRPYSSVDELVNKKVVGQATFSKIKDQISL